MAAQALPPAIDHSTLVVISATRNEHRSVPLVLAEMARARDELDAMGIAPRAARRRRLRHARDGRGADLRGQAPRPAASPSSRARAGASARRSSPASATRSTRCRRPCWRRWTATASTTPPSCPRWCSAKLDGDDLLVIGSRFAPAARSRGLTRRRQGLSKVGNQLIRRLSHKDLPADATTSFRVFEPELARQLPPPRPRRRVQRLQLLQPLRALRGDHGSLSGGADPLPAPPRRQLEPDDAAVPGSSPAASPTSAVGLPQWGGSLTAEPFGDVQRHRLPDELSSMPNYPGGSSTRWRRGCTAPSSRSAPASAR